VRIGFGGRRHAAECSDGSWARGCNAKGPACVHAGPFVDREIDQETGRTFAACGPF
jgi:hypothetical protein